MTDVADSSMISGPSAPPDAAAARVAAIAIAGEQNPGAIADPMGVAAVVPVAIAAARVAGAIADPLGSAAVVPIADAPADPIGLATAAAPPDAVADPIAELTAALASRDQFLAFVDHELRNALAPAVLLADQFDALARDPLASSTVASRAAMLTRSLRRFVTTIRWVAEVTELCRGKLQLEPTPLDLAQTAAEVCRELAAEAAACGAALVVEPGAPVAGSWDRARLKQLVTSLVSHAIHHAGGRVELCVRGRGDAAELTVRDHGPSLDACALARLFESFDAEPRARGSGHDLSLWVARNLASAMHGSVTANACADGGACFCVVVPRG